MTTPKRILSDRLYRVRYLHTGQIFTKLKRIFCNFRHWFSGNFFRYYHFFRRSLTFRDNCPVRFQDIRQRPDSSRFLCCRCRKCRQKRLHLRHTDNTEHSGKHCCQRFFPNFHVILLVLLFLSHLFPAPKTPAGDSARRQCESDRSRLSVRAGTDAARCTA